MLLLARPDKPEWELRDLAADEARKQAVVAVKARSVDVFYVTADAEAAGSLEEHKLAALAECLDADCLPRCDAMRATYRWIRRYRHEDAEHVRHYTSVGYSRVDTDAIEDYFVEEFGFYVLGSGHFSTVIVCPWDETKAIKIGYGPGAGGTIREDAWLSWAAFCMYKRPQLTRNQAILPNIYHIVSNPYSNVYVALMDRYECTIENYRAPNDDMQSFATDSWAEICRAADFQRNHIGSPPNTPLTGIADILADPLCPGVNDLHRGNVMVNTDGECVLTDPSSSDYRLGATREALLAKLGIIL